MSLDLVSEVWDSMRDHIDVISRRDAADSLIHLLIDNNYEIDDIKRAFKDKDVTAALKGYADEHYQEEEYEDNDDSDEEDW